MLTMQRPQQTPNSSHPSLPGPRMNPALGIILTLVALAAVFAGIAIGQSRVTPPPSASVCSGAITQAQVDALSNLGAGIDTDFSAGEPSVSTSGDAALRTSEQQLGPGVSPARCVVEALVTVSTAPDSDVLTATDFRGWAITSALAWMVILQGVGVEQPTPTVPAYTHPTPSAGPDIASTASRSLDLVVFVDAYSDLYLGQASIPSSTEQ